MILLFDLDNTLLDDKATKVFYLPRLFDKYKSVIKADFQQFAESWQLAIPKYYKPYTEGKLSFEEQRQKRVVEAFNNHKLSKKQIDDILYSFDNFLAESWLLFEGWDVYLKKSKLPKAIVTNGNVHHQNAKIDRLGIHNYFTKIFISEEIGLSKPDPELFRYVCTQISVNAQDCIFIGDSWYYDVQSSVSFGMKAFWLNHFEEKPERNFEEVEIFKNVDSLIKRLMEVEGNV